VFLWQAGCGRRNEREITIRLIFKGGRRFGGVKGERQWRRQASLWSSYSHTENDA